MSMKLGGTFATSSSNTSSTRPDSVPSGAENSPVPNRPPYPIAKMAAAIERMDATRTSHRRRYTRRPQAANIASPLVGSGDRVLHERAPSAAADRLGGLHGPVGEGHAEVEIVDEYLQYGRDDRRPSR